MPSRLAGEVPEARDPLRWTFGGHSAQGFSEEGPQASSTLVPRPGPRPDPLGLELGAGKAVRAPVSPGVQQALLWLREAGGGTREAESNTEGAGPPSDARARPETRAAPSTPTRPIHPRPTASTAANLPPHGENDPQSSAPGPPSGCQEKPAAGQSPSAALRARPLQGAPPSTAGAPRPVGRVAPKASARDPPSCLLFVGGRGPRLWPCP